MKINHLRLYNAGNFLLDQLLSIS